MHIDWGKKILEWTSSITTKVTNAISRETNVPMFVLEEQRGLLQRFKPQLTAPLPEGWFAKESITLLAPDGQANVIASSEPLDRTISAMRKCRASC